MIICQKSHSLGTQIRSLYHKVPLSSTRKSGALFSLVCLWIFIKSLSESWAFLCCLLGMRVRQAVEGESVNSSRESPPFDPLGQLYIQEGRRCQFTPGPLTNTIFTNRPLGHHMRPIYNMGWAIPPTVAPQLLWFDGYSKA